VKISKGEQKVMDCKLKNRNEYNNESKEEDQHSNALSPANVAALLQPN
jgi:hypothetical protein